MPSPKYVCIHGHFYQPPRENPWLGIVEVQDSAAPFHDWNERVTHESYALNTRARLLDDRGRIINILNNYAWMSFNFGPTLLQWMADSAPDVLEKIVEADRLSRELRRVGRTTVIPFRMPDGRTFWRVRVGPADSVESADRLLASVAEAGHPQARIVVE